MALGQQPDPTLEALLPTPGATIGEYQIMEEIGLGGFGAVFRAFQPRLKRDVAVKVVLPALSKTPDTVQRFMREIDLAARLEHPNVVRLYDYGQSANGLLWMSMEYVKGVTLSEVLRSQHRLPFQLARHIILQVLSGLIEAHEQLIIHRDLKPGNVMLTRKGGDEHHVKVLDFGIGKALGASENQAMQNLTETGAGGFGTPRYMAPEQIYNKDLGPWTDVYPVGLILYEMLVGSPAVAGDNAFEVLANQVTKPIHLPNQILLSSLGPVLQRAIEKDAAYRYRSAQDFFDALQALTQDPFDSPNASGPMPPIAAMGDDANQTVRPGFAPEVQRDHGHPPASPLHRPPSAPRPQRAVPLAVWLVAVAVFAVGITLVLVSVLSRSTPAEDHPAATPPTPTPVATAPAQVDPETPPEPPSPAAPETTAAPEPQPPTEFAAAAAADALPPLRLHLQSQPTAAEVSENGKVLGVTPLSLELARDSLASGRTFVLKKRGYHDHTHIQHDSAEESITQEIALRALPKKPVKGRDPRPDEPAKGSDLGIRDTR